MPIKHRHQSTLPSIGADVDVQQWNDAHVIDTGGTQGQVLVRDTTNADGWSWSSNVSAAVPTNPFNLTGGQIAFPATQAPSSNANTLDDYEEGTFTPSFWADGGASGQVYAFRTGFYTKVGRLVTVQFDVKLSSKGTLTGNVLLIGFPIAGSTNTNGPCTFYMAWQGFNTALIGLMTQLAWSATYASVAGFLFPMTAATANPFNTTMGTSYLTDASQVTGCAQYFVV